MEGVLGSIGYFCYEVICTILLTSFLNYVTQGAFLDYSSAMISAILV
jgi:hypothetical protein